MLLLSDKSMVFDHADPYAVSGYVDQHVGHHCIQLPSKGSVSASLSHRKFASMDLCRISYGGSARVTSEALETIYVRATSEIQLDVCTEGATPHDTATASTYLCDSFYANRFAIGH